MLLTIKLFLPEKFEKGSKLFVLFLSFFLETGKDLEQFSYFCLKINFN